MVKVGDLSQKIDLPTGKNVEKFYSNVSEHISSGYEAISKETSSSSSQNNKSKIFPSIRFLIAILVGLCFTAIAVASNNISVSSVCMIKSKANETCYRKKAQDDRIDCDTSQANWLDWSPIEEGKTTFTFYYLFRDFLCRTKRRSIDYAHYRQSCQSAQQ